MKASNALTTQRAQAGLSFSEAMQTDGMKKLLESSIADPKKRARFATAILATVSANPALKGCDSSSIISSALQGEALELSPSPALGHYYVVPYGDKATFQIGVNGLKQLAMRSGQYRDIDTIEVREGEYKGRDSFTGKPLFEFISDDEERESKPIIGYLAYFELLNGFRKTVYFSKEKTVNWAHRYSQAFDKNLYKKYEKFQATGEGMSEGELRRCSSPWFERFDAMGQKTVLRQLLGKWGILSIDLQAAIEQDENAEAGANGFDLTGDDMVADTTPQAETIEAEIIEPEKKPKARKKDAVKALQDEEAAYEDFFKER